MRDTLICTVGTSLLGNITRAGDPELGDLWKARNAKGLAVRIASFLPDERILGAEINSIHSIISQGMIQDRKRVIFLVSDTDEGRFTGSVLDSYYQNNKTPDKFDEATFDVIDGLTDEDVNLFRNTGLKNLVRLISEQVRKYSSERMLINATGGYKAQISFAGMIGQAFNIPVCYLFERFSSVIELPPQPVSLDLSFWLEFADTFFDLNRSIESDKKWRLPDERFSALVEDIEVQGRHLSSLSATGQLFHETFRHRFMQQKSSLLPENASIAPNEKKIHYEDKNSGKHKGLEHYLQRICKVPYVKEIYVHYYNPDLAKPNLFRKSSKDIGGQIEGWFSNNGALTKFGILTTAQTADQLNACIADLNERFGSS